MSKKHRRTIAQVRGIAAKLKTMQWPAPSAKAARRAAWWSSVDGAKVVA